MITEEIIHKMTDNIETQKKIDEITRSYYDMVYKYVGYRVSKYEDICDITQEVFIDLINHFNKEEIVSVKKWLQKVAYNKIVDYYKAKNKTALYVTHVEQFEDSIELSYETQDHVSDKEIEEMSDRVLLQLSQDEKELHKDYFLNNATYAELSAKYATSEVTMRKRVSRLKYKLEKSMSQLLFTINSIILFSIKIFL